MTKTNKKLMSLVVAVMYALCILVAAPVTAYADTSSHQTSAYTATQKWRATYYAQKSLAGLPSSKYNSWSYHTGDSAKLQALVTVTERRLATAKRMGLKITTFKNYYRLAIAKARVVVLLANEARVAAAALAAKAAKLVVDTASAKVVTDSIVALPTTITLANAAAVTAARTAYTALNVEAKALVLPATLATLVAAELKIVGLNGVFAVTSVTAPNAKQILVTFNKAVDETTATDITNYSVYDNGSSTVIGGVLAATLQADGKSVMLLVDSLAVGKLTNLSNAKVVVAKTVKDAALVALGTAYTNTTVAVSDLSRPTVTKVMQTAPNKIKVYFSEPIYDNSAGLVIGTDNFKVDNGSYIVAAASAFDYDTYAIELTTGGNLTNATHTLIVNPVIASDLIDFAGFEVATAAETTFTTPGDTVAPTATIKTISQTSVKFLFNKAITNAKDANVAYRHSVNGTVYQVLGTSTNVTVNPAGTEVTVNFNAAGLPLPTGTATLFISYISSTGTKILDAYNNEFVAASYTGTVAADATKPTVTAALASGSNTQIEVTVSETITGGMTAANYVLKNAAGTIIAQTGAVTSPSTNVYKLTYAALSGTYTLTVAGLKDTAVVVNTMDTATISITVADTIVPFVTLQNGTTAGTTYFTQADAKHVRVYFSEAMNTTDLTTLTNYQNQVDAFANPTAAVVAANGKSVFLTFANNVTGNLIVGQMKDAAGNKVVALSQILTTASGANVGLSTTADYQAIATSPTVVKVYLNDILTAFSASDFEVDKTGAIIANGINGTVTNATENGETVLTITLPTAIAKDQWNTAAPNVATVSGPHIIGIATTTANAFGAKVNFALTPIDDGIAPELATANAVTAVDFDNDGKIDHIKVTFSEMLNKNYVSADKFTVAGYTVTDAFAAAALDSVTARPAAGIADAKTVYVTVTEKTTGTDITAVPAVTIAAGLKDMAGNAFVAGTIPATVAIGGGTGVTGTFAVTTQGTTVAEVLPANVPVGDAGLVMTFGAGTGATLNTSTFKLGTIAEGTVTSATFAAGIFTINGDFDNTTTVGMASLASIQTAVTTAAGAPAGAAFITVTGPVTQDLAASAGSAAVVGGVTAATTNEVATFTVSTPATAAGNIYVTVDGVVTAVAVLATDTTAQVATKISTALIVAGWVDAPAGPTVTLTKAGAQTDLVGSVQ